MMRSGKTDGRLAGILLILQLAAGLMLPFILIKPMTSDVQGFLTSAAGNVPQIRVAVLVAFLGSALTVAIAITAWPVLRRRSERAALWFLAACVTSLVMDSVHNAAVMSILSLRSKYGAAGMVEAGLPAMGAAVASVRYWAHYTQLLFIGAWISTFYFLMLRFALIPRVLAGLGLLGIALQFTGVTLPAFLGYRSIVAMAMPLAPIHVAVSAWLIWKGFKETAPAAA
jgi:hypothetical protein